MSTNFGCGASSAFLAWGASVEAVVDAPRGEFPIRVADLSDESKPPIRCVARERRAVGNRLDVANMHWDGLAESMDHFGVFRGFD